MVLMHNDEMISGLVPKQDSVSVTADGVKAYGTLLNELYALIDTTKLTQQSTFTQGGTNFVLFSKSSSTIRFTLTRATSTNVETTTIAINATNSSYIKGTTTTSGTTFTTDTNTVPTNGTKFTLYY